MPWAHHAAYLLMLVVAILASVTDLRRKVVPNALIRWALVATAALLAVVAASMASSWPLPAGLPEGVALADAGVSLVANALFGLVVSVLLYCFGLWAAGDAKLAIVLALAQPAWIELPGPLPWAPFTVLLGNTFLAALVVIVAEVAWRRVPELVRGLRASVAARRLPFSVAALAGVARITLAVAALVAALAPIRQLAGRWAEGRVSGGYFLALVVLVMAYRPLKRLVSTRFGLVGVAVVFIASAVFMVATGGRAGALELGRTLLFCLAVMSVLGLLGAATRPLDTRAVPPEGLEPGMILTEEFLDALEVEKRWVEAFAEPVGSLRGVKLDGNLIDNLREWQAHNAPEEDFLVKTHVPFAPAFALGVILTAVFGRLVFTLGSS